MSNNIITYGLKNVHYSKATYNESDDSWGYATPVELKGAQEFSSDLIGGSSSVYADDQVVATLNQNAGRTITLKLTEITDEFKTDILGYKKARRVWFYLCTCAPINEATKSKTESVEANSISLTITARPIAIDDNNSTTHVTASKGDANYDTFLTTAPSLPVIK